MRMMLIGQRYRCQNVECGAEIEVKKASIEGRSNPRCCCGAEMNPTGSKNVWQGCDSRIRISAWGG